jgi:hypothetical protein
VHWPALFFIDCMITRQGAIRLIDAEFQRLATINIDSTDRITSPTVVYRPLEFVMAEKTVATIISKTLEQTPKYSGKPEENVDTWLEDLLAKFRMAEITESQALKIISTFLDGPAKEWFVENRTLFETWVVLKTEFINTYSSPATKQLASQRLRTRHQRADEPIIEYYTDVLKLCKIVDPHMTDASKIDHLCHGLKFSLMREVLRHAPRTPAEFLEHAKQEEVLDGLVNTSLPTVPHEDKYVINSPVTYFSSASHPHAVTSYPRYYQPDSRGFSSNNRTQGHFQHRGSHQMSSHHPTASARPSFTSYLPERSQRCYRCNKPGHFARDCWTTKNY